MIYFVEDDESIRKLVCYALSKEGYDIEGFVDAVPFRKAMSKLRPELVLLDIMLPGEDGLSILKSLRSDPLTESIPVIMISAKESEFDRVTGLDLGADDYIPKPFGIMELSSRVRAVLRRCHGGRAHTSGPYTIGELYVDPDRHEVKVAGEDVTLSFKEYMLLVELLEAGGTVVKRDELLTRVWGEYYDESRTLDVHIRKLRVKLGAAGAMIKTVKNVGYKVDESFE